MPYKVKKITRVNTSSLEELGESVIDLAGYTEDEFARVASSLQDTEADTVWNRVPPKPRRGTTVYADGTNWNPGSGEGPYFFDGSTWRSMLGTPGALTDAPSDGSLYGRLNATWAKVPILRSYLAGLTLSTAGSSATFSVSAGMAADGTNVDYMSSSAAVSKTTGAWAVGSGNGALDTGSISNNTWYHVYQIKRPDTGVVDKAISLSASAPTVGGNIPSAYTLSRRLGAMKTNSSGQWTLFTQSGDQFLWDVPSADVNGSGLNGASALFTMTGIPPGIVVEGIFRYEITTTSGTMGMLIQSPLTSTQSGGAGQYLTITTVSAAAGCGETRVLTNTSQQIRAFTNSSGGTQATYIATYGWNDRRGRDA